MIGGLCSADHKDSKEGVLIKKSYIQAHHTENCSGHNLVIGRIDFEQEGHDMWMFIRDGNGNSVANSSIVSIVHSPNCKKCNPDKEEIPIVEEKKSDYWGW